MSNDPAYYLAARTRQLYSVSSRATMRELLRICRLKEIEVEYRSDLHRPGYYMNQPAPTIILKSRNCPWVLAHELFHHWISENISHGIVYAYCEYANDDVEEAAQRYAALMCGSLMERAVILLRAS